MIANRRAARSLNGFLQNDKRRVIRRLDGSFQDDNRGGEKRGDKEIFRGYSSLIVISHWASLVINRHWYLINRTLGTSHAMTPNVTQ